MISQVHSILLLLAVVCTAQGLGKWDIGEEHLKRIFGKEAFDNGNIPNHKVVHAYPREGNYRNRRQEVDSNELLYIIESPNETINLTLSLNNKLLSTSSVVQVYKRNGSLETINSFPKNCYYFGKVDGDPNSRVAVSLCENKMVGVVETSSESYLVEPLSGSAHIAYETQSSPLPEIENIGGANNEGALPCPKLDDLENGRIIVEDYYVGSTATYQCAKGFRRVGPRVRQCLSTALWSGTTPVCVPRHPAVISDGETPELLCPQLSHPRWGAVRINYNVNIGSYEAVYQCEQDKSINGDKKRYCSDNSRQWSGQEPTCIPDEMLDVYINGLSHGRGLQRKSRQEGKTRSMELMVFVDSGVVKFHGSDIIVNYIMAIMNIMASLYHEPTLRTPIDLVISRLILEEEGESSSLNLPEDATAALYTFCQFQSSLNTKDESSALHHDHAILITSVDICSPDEFGICNTGVVGFAPVGGMCSFSRSCSINKDRGLGTAFVVAHETGHNLGMHHDGFLNDCDGPPRIMAPSTGGRAGLFLWSNCSADYLTTFLNSGNGECLDDSPIGGRLNASALEGLNFGADAQCRAIHGPTARLCPVDFAVTQLCYRLWCQLGIGQTCLTRNVPSADGTSCGENQVCFRGSCKKIEDVIIPINGGWSAFGPYGECSRTCESGVRFRERHCNNPVPEFGGKLCEGESREYEICNTDECPDGARDFRDIQCAATDDVLFDGKFHSWESFNGQFPSEVTPCQLLCQTDGGSTVAVRASSVIDGTKCVSSESPSAVCTQGACIPLGCDNVLNSDVREDICGVCNGNDHNATGISDSATGSNETGYLDIGTIPSGARNVKIIETSPSAIIALKLGNADILNEDFEMFSPGSYMVAAKDFNFVYNRSSSGMDVAFINGPLSEQLFVRAFVIDAGPYTLMWDYKICNSSSPSTTSAPETTSVLSTIIPSSTAPPSSITPPSSTTPSSSSTVQNTTISTTSTTGAAAISPHPISVDCSTYDLCGVCNGDNSSANITTGSFSKSGVIDYYDAVTIPAGARHIMVYEDPSNTDSFIALTMNGNSILNGLFRIKSSTVFTDDNGVVFTYIRSPKESVSTPGPLSQPLTVQGLIGVSQGEYSLSWSYVMCDVTTPMSTSSILTTTLSPAVNPTPEVLFPLWSSTRYGRCSLNDEGACLRSREVFCMDGMTGVRLSNDNLCAARRKKLSTTLRCSARLCQQQTNK